MILTRSEFNKKIMEDSPKITEKELNLLWKLKDNNNCYGITYFDDFDLFSNDF